MKMMYFDDVNSKSENIPAPVVKKFRFGLLQVMGIVALAVMLLNGLRLTFQKI
jgi:hypothetical protein